MHYNLKDYELFLNHIYLLYDQNERSTKQQITVCEKLLTLDIKGLKKNKKKIKQIIINFLILVKMPKFFKYSLWVFN